MSPENEDQAGDPGWGVPDQVRSHCNTGCGKEQIEDQMHGQELKVVGQIVGSWCQTALW